VILLVVLSLGGGLRVLPVPAVLTGFATACCMGNRGGVGTSGNGVVAPLAPEAPHTTASSFSWMGTQGIY